MITSEVEQRLRLVTGSCMRHRSQWVNNTFFIQSEKDAHCHGKSWTIEKSEFRYSNVYSDAMEVQIYESNLPSENNRQYQLNKITLVY